MAADLSLEWLCSLPRSWTYGITRGGRVFFINEEAQSTTWLHPLTGEAVVTGHRRPSTDLPTGWEEAYTFEGARYYINHNERKVTCKHPVTGQPSQDNCIFIVNDQAVGSMTSEDKKERPGSLTNEAVNYSPASDYVPHPLSPGSRTSRTSKKVHNFGKRSNSIKRNPNAPVVRRGWLYKQDSAGMRLWKKRWFVLSDLCLFYYRDEKEEGVLGSILLPSFQIAMLTSEDHIHRKFAFKAAHPNMRTYYFCTDTGKEMELWMKAMLDAALVHTEPVKRITFNFRVDKIPRESPPVKETNNIPNHRLLVKPETQNNQRNKELSRLEDRKALEAEKYGFQKEGQERPLTKINSAKLTALPTDHDGGPVYPTGPVPGRPGHASLADPRGSSHPATTGPGGPETSRVLQRTNSMLQLEQWIKIQKGRSHEEEPRGVLSYQTLPRNMPSHRGPTLARYPEGYRTLPRNSKPRPDGPCSAGPRRPPGPEDQRRPARGDTMWQLYEWQQRQWYSRQGTLPRPAGGGPASPSRASLALYPGFSSPQHAHPDLLSSPHRPDLTLDRRLRAPHPKQVYVPDRRSMPASLTLQSVSPQSLQGKTPEELTLLLIQLRRQQAELSTVREHMLAQLMQLKLEAHSPKNEILSHHLQRNALCLDHQMKENEPIITLVHTLIENSALRPQLYQQLSQDGGTLHRCRPEEPDIDAKLSRLCEQEKVVHALKDRLQQLHKEKYTLEQALLSVSQEIETSPDNPAAIQTVLLQREDLQNGLLSTCRELSRATAELERAWREYDKLEYDVTVTRKQMQEQLDHLGGVQTESAGIQRAQVQKDIWRIQDVIEGLSKHKQQRGSWETGTTGSKPFSTVKYKNEEEEIAPPRPPPPRPFDFTETPPPIAPPLSNDSSSLLCYSRGPVHLPEETTLPQGQAHPRNGPHCGPDYRLYKSEPELTTVAEVDESNGDEKAEPVSEAENTSVKGSHFPAGVMPPRTKSPTPESSTIASYVTLRKTKKMLDLRTERPRSAVEQLCLAESSRPRMTVQEQMERIRRHQQACLRERKKGVLGPPEPPPAQSPRESPSPAVQAGRELSHTPLIQPARLPESATGGKTMAAMPPVPWQTPGRDDGLKDPDAPSTENDAEPKPDSPTEDVAPVHAAQPQSPSLRKELKRTEDVFYSVLSTPEPKELNSEESGGQENREKPAPGGPTCRYLGTGHLSNHHHPLFI
ncbi:pleckstrin homology domain-containing family A member 5 [Thomomys bottae]